MRLFVIRHGETAWNREGRIQGHRDSPLTERGVAQARAVGGRLARERIDALYTSDLGRARETARSIGEAIGLEPRERPGLRERRYGVLEGLTWAEARERGPDDLARFSVDADYAVPGGESAAGFRDRVLSALAAIVADRAGERVAVVTHGGVVDVLHRELAGLPLLAPRGFPLVNAAVNEVLHVGGRWELVRWGDAAHLEVVTAAE